MNIDAKLDCEFVIQWGGGGQGLRRGIRLGGSVGNYHIGVLAAIVTSRGMHDDPGGDGAVLE